jgi:uncharacterized protein
MLRLIAFVFALFAMPTALAASFDCQRAATVIEKLICKDAELSKLDTEMAKVYRMVREDLDVERVKELIESQKSWIASRNSCKSAVCLKFFYDTRINTLRDAQPMSGNLYFDLEPANESESEVDASSISSMLLKCNFADHNNQQYEVVRISLAGGGGGEAAGIKTFVKKSESKSVQFEVKPGEFAECVYPSGNRVRLKVGEESVNPMGQCGADPMYFASIWVNGRKVESRLWFAGHCMDDGSDRISYRILGGGKTVVSKCESRKPVKMPAQTSGVGQGRQPSATVCTELTDIAKVSVDPIEYPPAGAKRVRAGTVEQLFGRDDVCTEVQKELTKNLFAFSRDSKTTFLQIPAWKISDIDLPKELQDSGESIFDFDNDGYLDRVFVQEYQSTYMLGSSLLVQLGRSATALSVSANPVDQTSMYLPCQMDKTSRAISDCPAFSQNADEAGFEMPAQPGQQAVFFRGRYTWLDPFRFRRTSFLGLRSGSYSDKAEYVAIVKPLPGRKFQPMCLFRRVPENF